MCTQVVSGHRGSGLCPDMDDSSRVSGANHLLGGMDGSEKTHRGQPLISQSNSIVSSGVNLNLNTDNWDKYIFVPVRTLYTERGLM